MKKSLRRRRRDAGAAACYPGWLGVNPVIPVDLRVMSFNIRYCLADDGGNDWKNRKHRVAGVISLYSPDILCLQEGLSIQLDDVLVQLPSFTKTGVGREDGMERGEFAPILFRTDRFTLLDQGTFWFSDTPHIPASMHWGNFLPRICSWIRLRCKEDGSAFTVFNVHWDHASQRTRRRSANLLMAYVTEEIKSGFPVIVCGDFNAEEDNLAFRHLVDQRHGLLRDSFRVLHPDEAPAGTFHAFTGCLDGARIDAIVISRHWQVREAGIVRSYFQDQVTGESRYPSDHFPVTATVSLYP